MRAPFTTLRRLTLLFAAAGALLLSSCGRPASLAVVNVTGLDPAIRELYVTMTLDGTAAKNSQPTADDDPNGMSFSIYKDMQQFGIDVPAGTHTLGVKIDGLNTTRVVVRTGSGTLDFTQRQDLDIALTPP